MKNKVFMSLRTQFSNLGDLLINHLLILELEKVTKVQLDSRGVPKWYLDIVMSGISKKVVVKKGIFLDLVPAVLARRECNYLMLKPGGYGQITSYSMLAKRFLQGLWFQFLRFIGVAILRAPSSQKNTKSKLALSVEKFRLMCVKEQLIRDPRSCKEIEQLGLSFQPSYDLATLLFKKNKGGGVFSPKSCPIKNLATFSFRCRPGVVDLFDSGRLKARCRDVGLSVAVVTQVFEDGEVNNEIAEREEIANTVYDGSLESIDSIVDIYSRSKYVVSNRLHVLMLAAAYGAIPIALVTDSDEKVSSYMESINCSSNIFFINNVCIDNIGLVFDSARDVDRTLLSTQADLLSLQIAGLVSGD